MALKSENPESLSFSQTTKRADIGGILTIHTKYTKTKGKQSYLKQTISKSHCFKYNLNFLSNQLISFNNLFKS